MDKHGKKIEKPTENREGTEELAWTLQSETGLKKHVSKMAT